MKVYKKSFSALSLFMALLLVFALSPAGDIALAQETNVESAPAQESSEQSIEIVEGTASGPAQSETTAIDESQQENLGTSDAKSETEPQASSDQKDQAEKSSSSNEENQAENETALDTESSKTPQVPLLNANSTSLDSTLNTASDEANGDGIIYADGARGNDSNSGSEASPVKTFQKAKELLESSLGKIIYVKGTLTPTENNETWDLGGKRIARSDDFHGELIRVSKDEILTLVNIVVDGRSQDGQTGVVKGGDGSGGSLVGVRSGTLNIGEGAVLQNNKIESKGTWSPEAGGAIFTSSGVVNVNGGTIQNNSAVWGGGIYGTDKSTINMTSGSIANNKAAIGASRSLPTSYGGTGGGICATDGTAVNFSGGSITGNTAYERGGGISLGTYYAATRGCPTLTMTGGSISNNKSGASGGGLFVQAGYSSSGNGGVPTYAIARITGGEITNNTMTGAGQGNDAFGGGGIYVNGYSSSYSYLHNGELYLTNVEVTDNHASIAGGGYAACPVSSTEVDLASGAAFYGNTTNSGNARELYILASNFYGTHSGSPSYNVSPSMLGGGAYKWVYDNGTEVPLDKLKGTLKAFWNQSLSLSNEQDENSVAVQKALKLASVRISGNTSTTRGGGIGSNGSVFIGETVKTMEISVSKSWNDADNSDGLRPASIEVELYRDGEYVGYQVMKPDSNGNWFTVFRNLPIDDNNGHDYVYTVSERAINGYINAVETDSGNGFIITNTPPVSVSGTKVWDDANNQDGLRPTSISIVLLRNGVAFGSTTATDADNWEFTFNDLPKYDADGNAYVYTVSEASVEGYTSTVSGDAENGFTVTNAHKPAKTSVAASKVWNDENNEDGIRPASVIIKLYANGSDTGISLVLNEKNGWAGVFQDLDECLDGVKIAYSIVEDPVSGYTSTVSGDAQNGYVVTNSHTPEENVPPKENEKTDKPKSNTPVKQAAQPSLTPNTSDNALTGEVLFIGLLAAAIAAICAFPTFRNRKTD